MAQTVKTGDTIMLRYTGKCEEGKVFDSTRVWDPIAVKVGAREMVKGLEKIVLGVQPGEKKTVCRKDTCF